MSENATQALRSDVQGEPLLGNVALRRYEDVDGASIVLNGNLLASNGDVFGELLRYNPDTNIPLVFQSEGRIAELTLGEAERPNGADYLKGMLFFMLRGDHAFIIERELSIGALERYLRWLIFTLTKVGDRDARVRLVPRALLDDEAALLKAVSRIVVSPPPSIPNMLMDSSTAKELLGDRGGIDIVEVLRAAHFDTAVLDRLAGADDTAVKVTINVEFKSGRRKRTISGDDALALLRDVPEEELIIDGDGVQKNRGSLQRLTLKASVEQKGNVLERKSVFGALNDAAARYRKDGVIE